MTQFYDRAPTKPVLHPNPDENSSREDVSELARVVTEGDCGGAVVDVGGLGAGHEPFLDHDLRDGISVGERWRQRLYRELHEVDAVIGVVTSSFVASTWCGIEMGIADALGCRLIPVRAEAGMVHPLMRDLQYTDYQADPQQARDRVLHAVRLLGVGGGAWGEGKNPFPGLEPFTAELSRVFFGRAGEACEVSNRLRAMGSAGGMLAIIGSSGCGKSSLVNAAVMPLVDSDPTWLAVPTLVPGTDPLPELARVLAATATRLKLSWSASDVRGRLEAGTDGLRRVADDPLAVGPVTRRRLLITIDQTEELFTRTTLDARQRFAQLLRDAVAGPVRVVAAMRSEFLDSGLAAALVADTDSGEALPLLAFILRQLADGLPAGGALTLSQYRDLGGVQGALIRHADAALAEAVTSRGLTDREVLAGLTRLVTVDETGRRARRRIRLASLTKPLQVALRVFVDRHLLISGADDNDQVWLTVAHEALLTGWRPLDTATADIIAALRTARAVEQAAAEWNDAQRPAHFLWDAERLTATLATLGILGDGGSRDPASLSLVECDDEARAFLDATGQHVHAVKERERRRRTAQAQRDTAIFDQITAQADRLRSTDVSLAAQLDLIAYRMRPTPDLYAALITTENAAFATPLAGHTDSVEAVAFSPHDVPRR